MVLGNTVFLVFVSACEDLNFVSAKAAELAVLVHVDLIVEGVVGSDIGT